MKIKCMIIDDEPISREIIRRYLDNTNDFEIVSEAKNAAEAIQLFNTFPVDAIFLDINMPKLSGLNMIRYLSRAPCIVFITAFPEYAVKGFEIQALDYLLKPVSPERFSTALDKVRKKVRSDKADGYLLIKSERKTYRVLFNEIQYFKGSGDYVRVIREGKSLITKKSLKSVLQALPDRRFAQIHRSYIVNLDYMEYIENGQLSIKSDVLPIGETFREQLVEKIKTHKASKVYLNPK